MSKNSASVGAVTTLNELRALASSGAITLRVAGEYPPEDVADAHRAMETGGLRGRGIIVF